MPNWTSNTLRAEGKEADLRAFLEAVKWQDEIFDFNRLIPMPDLLHHTGSGCCTIANQEVNSWFVNDLENPHGEGAVRLFNVEEEAELKMIGYRNWYDWSCENWGTKWNACRAELAEDCVKDGYIEIHFETAWAEPRPVLRKMFEMFPQLSFVCTWQYEGDNEVFSVEHPAAENES